MFWRFNYSTSQLHTILDKEDVTLKEVMDEEDVLQECKSNNEKLVNFLIKEDVLNELVENTINLPSEALNEKERFKYSTISCELLTSDIAQINDALADNQQIMDKLYSFLVDNDQKNLNPLMASYFAKVIGCLISRKTEAFLNYIQKRDDFLTNFLKNINTSAITDILLRLLTTIDSSEQRYKVIEWLKKIKLVDGIIDLFSHEYSNEIHSNASQILCDLIRISRDQILTQRELVNDYFITTTNTNSVNSNSQQEKESTTSTTSIEYLYKNSLLDEIESEHVLNRLFDLIFDSIQSQNSNNCSLVYGIEVFLTLLEPAVWSNELEMNDETQQNIEEEKLRRDRERVQIAMYGLKTAKNSCLKYLNKLNDLLINLRPKADEHYNFSNGTQIPVLGSNRLAIVKLISKLFCLNDQQVNQELIKLASLNVILDMMFVYKWNNFLHSQLKEMITNCLMSDFKRLTNLSNNNQQMKCSANVSLNENENKNENEDGDIEMKNDANNEANENEIDEENKNKSLNNNLNKNDDLIRLKLEDVEIDNFKTFTRHLLEDCNLIKKFIHAWSEYFNGVDEINEKKIVMSKPSSVGYIGHLNTLSNLIFKYSREGKFNIFVQDCLNKYVEKDILETWNDLNENNINRLNELNSKDLVRNPFLTSSLSTTEPSDFIDLPSDERMNKKFADLQKEMKINCVEDFSISESQIVNFNNSKSNSETTIAGSTKTKSISFSLESNDESAQMFEQVCMQRDSMNLSTSVGNSCILDEDVWVTKEIKFSDVTTTNNNNKTNNNSTFEIAQENWAVFSSDKDFNLKIENKNLNDQMSCTKKYSDKLSLSNYSSSSSSSSSSSDSQSSSNESSEEDNNQNENRVFEKNRNRNKRQHRQNQQNHKESKYKESKEENDVDFFKNATGSFNINMTSNQNDENWADFGEFMSSSRNEAKSSQVEVAVANTTEKIDDPWNSLNENKSSSSNTVDNKQDEEKKDEQTNWANFDNF